MTRVRPLILLCLLVLATNHCLASGNLDSLIRAARAEGQLTTIALPHNWCGYGELIEQFKSKYGIRVNELNPNAGSGDEIEAIKANRNNTGPQAPDVVDVGLQFGPQAKADGLFQPYKVASWDEIPGTAKDPDGYWYGDYYGVMSFEVNKDLVRNVPHTWADLMKPEYANSVALAGDPRSAAQAIMGVYAAGLGSGGTDAQSIARKGIAFYKLLNITGNFVPVTGGSATLAQGATPIIVRWDYLALADRENLGGNPPVDVIVPTSGVIAGIYVQAISAFAPHPNAAKLWMEYLYSDEGQLGWLKGFCHPIRFNAMASAGKIPAALLARLPPAANYSRATFPSLEDQARAKQIIVNGWGSVVVSNGP